MKADVLDRSRNGLLTLAVSPAKMEALTERKRIFPGTKLAACGIAAKFP
jgi:hypothetical protein